MLFNWIRIPEKDADPSTREEFDTWVARLESLPDVQVFKNCSYETGTLLEKAHPETVVHFIRVDVLTPFSSKHAEQMREDMAFVQGLILTGNIVVFEPYKEYVMDGMRYTPKEVK